MIKPGDVPITALNVTEEELTVLVYAVEMFNNMVQTAPVVDHPMFRNTRSDRMKMRRASNRMHLRMTSLGKAYGIEAV